MAREGYEETRPRTERDASDQWSGRQHTERRGRPFGGSRAPTAVAWTAGRTAPDARFGNLPHAAADLPPLPPSFDATLGSGLAALGLDLPDRGRRAIDGHVRLLLGWNAAINLTAITDPVEIATRHVLDSLSAVPLLAAEGSSSRRRTPPGGATTRGGAGLRILDLGSGGGFPGLPLAAALADAQVTLADSVAKKAAFLQVVVAATALADRVTARATRAEALAAAPARWDVVTARAVGSLPDLVELALPLLEVGGRLIAWKRGAIEDELLGGQRAAEALGGGSPELRPIDAIPALAGHVLVTVTKHRPTPAGYPRDPARRSRQPW